MVPTIEHHSHRHGLTVPVVSATTRIGRFMTISTRRYFRDIDVETTTATLASEQTQE
jgi:hypothetical protein